MLKVLPLVCPGFFKYYFVVVLGLYQKFISEIIVGFHCFSSKSLCNPLLISMEFFIITNVCHLYLTSSFSSCIYEMAYLMKILYSLQINHSLTNINCLSPFTQSTFIEHSDLTLTLESHVQKVFTQ